MKIVKKIVTLALIILYPAVAKATSIKEFEGPLDTLANTFTGPVALTIITLGLAGSVFYFLFGRHEVDGLLKQVILILIAGVLILAAGSILGLLYNTFLTTGALL